MRPITALRDERRQPADLEIKPDLDQQVGVLQLQQETRLGFDEVWILIALGDRFNIDAVASDFLRQGGHVRGRGDHVQFLGFGCRRKKQRPYDRAKNQQKQIP